MLQIILLEPPIRVSSFASFDVPSRFDFKALLINRFNKYKLKKIEIERFSKYKLWFCGFGI